MAAGKSPPPHGLLAKVSRLGAGPGEGGHASRLGHALPRPPGTLDSRAPGTWPQPETPALQRVHPRLPFPGEARPSGLAGHRCPRSDQGRGRGPAPRASPLPLPYGGNPGKLPRPGGREGSGFGPPPPAETPRGRRGRGRLAPPVTCADTCPCAHSETSPQARGQLPSPRTGSLRSTRVCPQGPQHQD